MDTQRLILFIVFSFSIFLLWDSWITFKHAPPEAPQAVAPAAPDASVPAPSLTPVAPNPPAAMPESVSAALSRGERLSVKTDVYEAEIDLTGGDLRRLVLTQHGATLDRNQPLILMADEAPHFYVAQSGLLGEGLPTHKSSFTAAKRAYALEEGSNELVVRLDWQDENALQVAKIFTFRRGSYLIDIRYEIKNGSTKPVVASSYFQLLRDATAPAGESSFTPTYTGPAWYTEATKFQKHAFGDIGKDPKKDTLISKDGWIAMLQHYFLSAYLPPQGVQREFYTRKLPGELYAAGVILPIGNVEPGSAATVSMPLYAGPQEQAVLKQLAPGLDLAVDYGLLTVIAAPIFWLLAWIHKWVGNWGWAIILLTVIIKLAFYPLSAASYKSMAKMKVLAPRLQRLKEQYGNDRQKLHQAMMELYKTEKINPLGGCLPILIQIPVFIALYWVLLYSVEMRHAPFSLWIQDLTAPDPYYILPIIMGISMFVQTKLNPTPPDPIQAKVMMIMPVAFSVFFIFFPAGLVLYWVVNNIISIAQQWRINHVLEKAAKAARR